MKISELLEHRAGQGIVEFALVVPLLLFILFGMIDASRLIYHQMIVNSACKEAIRGASVGNDIMSVSERIKRTMEPVMGDGTSSLISIESLDGQPCTKISISFTEGPIEIYIIPVYNNTLTVGQDISVAINSHFEFVTPASFIIEDGVNIRAIYYARVESPPR